MNVEDYLKRQGLDVVHANPPYYIVRFRDSKGYEHERYQELNNDLDASMFVNRLYREYDL